jgi:hypothetical protein
MPQETSAHGSNSSGSSGTQARLHCRLHCLRDGLRRGWIAYRMRSRRGVGWDARAGMVVRRRGGSVVTPLAVPGGCSLERRQGHPPWMS